MSCDDEPNVPPEVESALEQERTEEDSAANWKTVWALLGRAVPSDDALPDADDTWAQVRRHVEEEASPENRRAGDRRPRRPSSRRTAQHRLWRWGSAAVIVLVLVVAVWWWSRPVEVRTGPGATAAHTLPDGSTVELNGDSRLTYPRTFASLSVLEAQRRVVHLQGEAYFEVEPGERPFIVRAPSVRVEVVGTAFSVRSRRGEPDDVHVALAEGQLRVTEESSPNTERTLRPGQATMIGTDGTLTAVRDTSINRILAWRRGGFAATGQPLPALTQALERRFGPSIRLDESISGDTRSDPLTLYYTRNTELETILHDVCMTRGLTYRATANGYVLARPAEPQSPRSP